MGGGGEFGHGVDLILIVSPEVGLLTDLTFPGEGIFEPVVALRGAI